MKKVIVGLIIAAVILAGAVFIFSKDPSKVLNDIDTGVFVVTLEKAQKRDLSNELLLSGGIKALEEAVLYPRAEGKLKKNLLKEGDHVKRDQAVALIERDEVGAVYEPLTVPSTITGIVGKIYMDAGEHAYKNTPVAFIVNQSKVRVLVDVPERYANSIYKNQKAFFSVESLPGKTFEAEVDRISPVVDTASRTVRVELLSDNKDEVLKSGMFASARIILNEKQAALSVTGRDVFSDENGSYVLVPGDGKAVRRDVKTGFEGADFTEITDGLSDGEQIINAVYGLKPGSVIDVRQTL